jgi:rhodanese-related sulfurtransferase
MKASFRFLFTLLLCLAATAALAAATPEDKSKQTKAGKYVDAKEAFEMHQASPAKVHIVDVRTPEEYDFVGHPAMAANVPVMLWTGKWNPEKKNFPLAENPDFVAELKKRYQPGDTLILMCRSGQRSAAAANKATEAGFTNVYSMVDGFEGDKVSDAASPDKGKRTLNGWRNAKAPWTYSLDEKLVYAPK